MPNQHGDHRAGENIRHRPLNRNPGKCRLNSSAARSVPESHCGELSRPDARYTSQVVPRGMRMPEKQQPKQSRSSRRPEPGPPPSGPHHIADEPVADADALGETGRAQ